MLNLDDDQSGTPTTQVVSPIRNTDTTPTQQFKQIFVTINVALDDISAQKSTSTHETKKFLKTMSPICENMSIAYDFSCKTIMSEDKQSLKNTKKI